MVEENRRTEDSGHRRLNAARGTEGPSPSTNWVAVWATFAGGAACGAFIGKVPPGLPLLRDELGLTLVESGFIATTLNLLGAVAGLLIGLLCDRFGHKRMGLFGLVLMASGGFLGAAADGYATLLFSRFLEGAGFILFTVTGAALVSASVADLRDRNRAMGLWTAYMPSGAALAMLLAPAAIAAVGWRGYWVALSIAALGCAVLVWRHVPARPPAGIGGLRLIAESLARPGAWTLACIFALYVAQWTSVMIWLPTVVMDERGGSPASAALLGALMVLANVPGNLAGGWLLSRGVRRSTLVVGASVIAAACSTGMLGGWLPDGARFALVLVFSCCAGVIPACVFSGVPVHARTPGHIATTNGLVMQTAQFGQCAAPILFAWLASRAGDWGVTLWGMLAFAALTACLGVVIGRIEGRMR